MKRPKSIPRHQLALCLEPQERYPLERETREALIAALADLLLDAYAMDEDAEAGEQGASHEP
jgi:hypothetical protein